MKLSEIKNHLSNLETIAFELPNGEKVKSHFHVTEVGKIVKDFIDCGGVVRHEEVVNFQLWEANDYDHKLHPDKLLNIIELSENKLDIADLDIEVEYQGDTIGKYGLDYQNGTFLLTSKATDCLAKDNCGIPKVKLDLSTLTPASACCVPGECC